MNELYRSELMEMYKLQCNLLSESSNRRASVHRQFVLLLSALIFGGFTLFRSASQSDALSPFEIDVVQAATVGIGAIVLTISVVWRFSIVSYLLSNSLRYDVLKELEDSLDFKFFQRQWTKLSWEKDKSYFKLARNELYLPTAFMVMSLLLLIFGLYALLPNVRDVVIIILPAIMPILALVYYNEYKAIVITESNIPTGG